MKRFVSDRYKELFEAIRAYEEGITKNPGVWELLELSERVRNAASVQVIIRMAEELESMECQILEMGERG